MKKKIEIKEQIFVLMKSKKIEEVEHCTDLRSLDEFLDFDVVEQQGRCSCCSSSSSRF
jgi:hypothetical protein